MDSGRAGGRQSPSSKYEAASQLAAQLLERRAADLKGPAYGAWARQARQRFIDTALRSEAPDGRPPSPLSIKQAIEDYTTVLKDVYGTLVLEPYILQDTALDDYGEARLARCQHLLTGHAAPAVHDHS